MVSKTTSLEFKRVFGIELPEPVDHVGRVNVVITARVCPDGGDDGRFVGSGDQAQKYSAHKMLAMPGPMP